ncbi:MAG: hypothetical protein QOH26_1483 [Actinomycetota bacterium]|nr:hypothetical protein [Actinomycetota bacterium]
MRRRRLRGLAAVLLLLPGTACESGTRETATETRPSGTAAPVGSPRPRASRESIEYGPPDFFPNAVAFWDASNGIVVGRMVRRPCGRSHTCRGSIRITKDGGETWTEQFRGGPEVRDVTITGAGSAVATLGRTEFQSCLANGLVHTVDGGGTWRRLSQAPVCDPSFDTPSTGWALHEPTARHTPRLAHTTDGGRSWTLEKNPCPRVVHVPVSLSFPSPRQGWLVCVGEPATAMESKAVLQTTDDGSGWSVQSAVVMGAPPHDVPEGGIPSTGHPSGMFFRPSGRGWMWLGRAPLLQSVDQGQNWTAESHVVSPDVDQIASLWFIDDSTGYALRYRGRMELLMSVDGGVRWSKVKAWRSGG